MAVSGRSEQKLLRYSLGKFCYIAIQKVILDDEVGVGDDFLQL